LSEKYRIFETEQFIKDLNVLKGKFKEKIYKKITNNIYQTLKNNPYYGKNIKKLKSWQPETWRYRIQNFRLFYEIDKSEKTVYIISFDQRKEAY